MHDMKKHSILCTVLAALLAGMLSVCAFAAFGYSGPIDEETGEPVSDTYDAYSDRVSVSDGVAYDRENGGFLFTITGSTRLLCSAADGQIVQSAVKVEADTGVPVTIYKNGTALEDPDLTHISDTGSYIVEATVNGQRYQVVSFTIVGEQSCDVAGYTMPDGFAITSATLDGEDTYFDSGYISMGAEGHYIIDYRCPSAGTSYELDLIVDTTPPTLALAELDDRNRARGPVSIADVESGASIGVYRDGKQISYSKELTESGDYQIVLMDAAGNVTHYSFTILVYFDLNSLLFIGIVIGIAVAMGGYIVFSRKRLQVR